METREKNGVVLHATSNVQLILTSIRFRLREFYLYM